MTITPLIIRHLRTCLMTVIDNAAEMKGIQDLIPEYIDKF